MLKSLKLWIVLLFSMLSSTEQKNENVCGTDYFEENDTISDMTLQNDIVKEKLIDVGQNRSCRVDFTDEQQIKQVVIKLHRAITLRKVGIIFLHLDIANFTESDEKLKNRFTEWEFLDSENDLMVQMPVDYRLLVFDFSEFNEEDANISLKLKTEPPGCYLSKNDIEQVKTLLWGSVLSNFSTHYLCNHNFTTSGTFKFPLFYITTVWIGYDLDCQTMSQWRANEYQYLRKDFQHVIIAVGCFLVAIQFFWLFHLILRKQNFSSDYKKRDRPSGVKRAIKKFLYKPIYIPLFQRESRINKLINIPTFRFSAVTNWSLLLSVGLYRVIYRQILGKKHFYFHEIVYSSEPLCDYFSDAYSCDLAYMLLSTYFVVIFATFYYQYLPITSNERDETCNICMACASKWFSKILYCCKNHSFENNILSDFLFILIVMLSPFLTILLCVIYVTKVILYICFVLFVGLLLPSVFKLSYLCRCGRKSLKLTVLIAPMFFIFSRSMISSLVFILRSITYFLFITFPLRHQLLQGLIVGMSIITYFIKYQIEMIDTNAEILSIIFEKQERLDSTKINVKYGDERLYTYVVQNLEAVKNTMNEFVCNCFLVLIYFLVTLQTISKSEHNTDNTHELFLSIFVFVLPWIVDAYFRKVLTDDDRQEIHSLVDNYYKDIPNNDISRNSYSVITYFDHDGHVYIPLHRYT